MCAPPDPAEFGSAATALLDRAEKLFSWAYSAASPGGEPGHVRYTIWSEVLVAPCCDRRGPLWAAAAPPGPPPLRDEVRRPGCAPPGRGGGCGAAGVVPPPGRGPRRRG